MYAYKCMVSLRHGRTLNSCRATSTLVRLVEEEEEKASKRNENYSKSPASLLKERRHKNSQIEGPWNDREKNDFAVAYTDGSSDISLNKGGAGILFQLPNKGRKMHNINTGLIASNFTSELLAIKEVFCIPVFDSSGALGHNWKSSLLQWIPAHVNIEGNECVDSLAKEGRNDDEFVPPLRLQMQLRSQITDFCLIATKKPSLSILIALEILHPYLQD
ncbi:hypothetical protein TNCV_1928801 [Trichonephila clavipes]|nr:hypothetical protein TNCV_1928801 [Trichonephila clavipes]